MLILKILNRIKLVICIFNICNRILLMGCSGVGCPARQCSFQIQSLTWRFFALITVTELVALINFMPNSKRRSSAATFDPCGKLAGIL